MKIIFLDIDGVLNSAAYMKEIFEQGKVDKTFSYSERQAQEINPVFLERVRRIVERTGAQIVISSSWRITHSLVEIKEYFVAQGWANPPIIDQTIKTSKGFRGDEVLDWVINMELGEKDYICLDDDGDFYPTQNLIQTSWEDGIQEIHVIEAIHRLGAL